MKGGIPTPEAGEIAKHIGDGRDAGVTETGPVASVRDRVDALNGVSGEVSGGIDHHHRQADAVGDVVEIVSRAAGRFRDPAYVEGVERAIVFYGGIVLRHGDNVDDAVAAIFGGAAHRAVAASRRASL